MDFDDPNDPTVIYIETRGSAQYLEKPHEVALFREIFEWVLARSLPLEEYLS
jgi:hypothetical protein